MGDVYYVDGRFVPAEEAALPLNDLAILRGYGVFDFMRTYHGRPFHLQAHIERLFRSAEIIGLEMPWTPDEIRDIVLQTLDHNTHPESNVRIVVTGGESPDFIMPIGESRLAVMVTKAVPPADHYYTDGAKIITVQEERYLPGAKSLNYISAIRALKEARAQGAVEAIYIRAGSHALEGTTTNLFIVQDGKLITPQAGILPGITRDVVLQIVDGLYPVEERDLHLDELYNADEVFITASNKQVMPIIQVDDATIAGGQPGEHTRRVMALFGEATGVALPMG